MFSESIEGILNDEDIRELQNFLMQNPEARSVIPGVSGLRKVRWASKGHGKRGGARVVYLIVHVKDLIYFIVAYAKNTKTDLTALEKKVFKQLVKTLKELL